MTGTSRALKRLGVAGLGAAVAFVGLVPLTEVAASAAPVTTATSVDISPPSDTAAVGTCNPFTITLAPTGGSVSVRISEPSTTSTTGGAGGGIGFCTPGTANDSAPGAIAASPTAGNTTATTGAAPYQCFNSTNNGTVASPSYNVDCETTYTDASNDGKIIIGVQSTIVGTMTVEAFGDANGNGVRDTTPAEAGDSSTKNWVANNPNAGTDKLSCTPATATNPTNTLHTFSCTVTDANGVPLPGAANVKYIITSGPDAGGAKDWSNTSNNPATFSNNVGPECTATDNDGVAQCHYTNNGTPGTDQITVYLEQNGIVGNQAEVSTTISKTWVNGAPQGSKVSVSCSPNPTNTTGTAPNTSQVCQDPTSDTSETFTATVTNGVPAQPQSGVLVQWSITQNNGGNALPANGTLEPAAETETLSAPTCTTDGTGTCSVTLSNPTPTEGEAIEVTATVPVQGGGTSTATGTKIWHDPVQAEARNITVAPDTQSATSGGAATLTATVTDRFANPVNNVQVNWTESGPGAFRSGVQCTTDATGKCTIEVSSLGTETGAETVTATIAGSSTTSECAAPADKSNFDPTGYNVSAAVVSANAGAANSTTFANATPGAPAGACSDSGTVTWKAQVTPPPTKKKVTAHINCFSPRKHVLKCRVTETPAKAGLLVRFKRITKSGVRSIGTDFTNSNGVAKLTKRHLKSHKLWKVFAHVYASSTTTGDNTEVDRTRIT